MTGSLTADISIKLLLVEESRDKAEKYVTALRNAGIAVHATRVDDDLKVQDALEDQPPDMILYSCATPDFSLTQAMPIFRRHADIPLIILYKDQDRSTLLGAMRDGARDIVAKDDLDHLQLVVKRELEHLLQKRRLTTVEQRLKESESQCNALMQTSNDAIAYVHEGMHVRANPAYLKMFGYFELDDVEGMPILDMVTSEYHQQLKQLLRDVGKEGEVAVQRLDAKCETSDGKVFKALLEFSPSSIDGEECIQVVISDRSMSMELEKKLRQLSIQDAQTGAYNRQYFLETLNEAEHSLKEKTETRGLMNVLLDDFHKLRQSEGLTVSDMLLKEIADVLKERIGEQDLLARFGDHSFLILTPVVDLTELKAAAADICKSVEEHSYQSTSQLVTPTCSIGITRSSDLASFSVQEFVNNAYCACEAASGKGGNQVNVFSKSDAAGGKTASQKTNELEQIVMVAVDRGRFRLVYQPIVSLQGDTRENYAVMVRMLNNRNEPIPPSEFLRTAETMGQMGAIDRWVVEHALSEIAKQRQEGKKIRFFISVAGSSIEDDAFLLRIYNLMEEHNVSGSWVTFQLSEPDVRNHIQEAKTLIDGLKKIGCEIAIDHFGLLPKPESLLKHLPVDFYKLDSSYMDGLARNQKKQEQMRELNELVASHHAKLIATAVEDANSLAILWNLGIDYLQGYFLQEPSEVIAYDFSYT